MTKLKINELDLSNKNKLLNYEKSFYESFKSYPDFYFKDIWDFNHEELTIKMKIPYSSQKILLAETENEIVGAVVINTNMLSQLQLEMFGFNIERTHGETAEILAIFANKIVIGRNVVLAKLGESCAYTLRNQGIKMCWATCSEKHLRGYISIGFLNRGKVNFNGIDKYLLYRYI